MTTEQEQSKSEFEGGYASSGISATEITPGLSLNLVGAIGKWIIPGAIEIDCRFADRRPTWWQQLWHLWLLGWVWEDVEE